MKRFKLPLVATVVAASSVMFFTSCKKEGCTDPDSLNYNAEAKKDDGSCTYEGQVVFWYGETTSENLNDDGSGALTFYVDGKVVGSTNTTVYWSSSPTCGDNGSITVTKDLGNVKTQSYSYKVEDDWGDVIWTGTLNINANTCFETELTY